MTGVLLVFTPCMVRKLASVSRQSTTIRCALCTCRCVAEAASTSLRIPQFAGKKCLLKFSLLAGAVRDVQ